jgi:alkaline phosphatase D
MARPRRIHRCHRTLPRFLLASAAALWAALPAGAAELRTGPMLGPVEMREARVWVQTAGTALVRVVYEDEEGNRFATGAVQTSADGGHTATLVLGEVEPGRSYTYRVELNGEVLEAGPFRFRTPPFHHERTPPPDFTVALASGHYLAEEGFEPPYRTLGGGYSVFDRIVEAGPAFMVWLGDSMTLRQSDWPAASGYLKRHAHARTAPGMGPLLSSVPQYAVWGGTDYGPRGAGRYYTQRKAAEKSFRAFWPAPATAPVEGLATRFRYSDADFFLLDVRTHRDDRPDAERLPVILGEAQIEWLRQELLLSDATFKVIMAGAPILNPAKSPENLSSAEREHTRLLEMLRTERISGLLFASGGKAYGELTRLVHAQSYNLHEITVGPLTANPETNEDELNYFRVPGTSSFERNFALLEFGGPEEDRAVTLRVLGTEGQELWSRTLRASQLQPAE